MQLHPDDALREHLRRQRAAFDTHGAIPMARRLVLLDALAAAVIRQQDAFVRAVSDDFGHRSSHETKLADLFPVVAGLRHARRNLEAWARPRRRPIKAMFKPASGEIIYQALGVVGIVGPWNYPVQLTLAPLIAAVAAGNRAMIKPSELTPRTAELLATLVAEVFSPEEVAVFQGGADLARTFTALPFDHLFFTGSTAVGRQVMLAAAQNLVPVTLELGGKSPVVIGPDYPIAAAAERIAVGKLFSAGQTCIAPDYALVPRGKMPAFVAAFEASVRRLYPTLAENPDYTAIVNDHHYERLSGLLDDAARRGAAIRVINPADERLDPARRKMAPVLVSGLADEAALLNEEIFGPILPVIPYDDVAETWRFINARPRPLAFYLFSNDRALVERALAATLSGGVAINDTLLQCVQEELPFGGVGPSGMGSYHGEAGFRTFSHARSVFRQSRFNSAGLTRPPFGRRVQWVLDLVLR